MEKLTKNISEIIISEIKTINKKVIGLNFLELLKAGIIEKLLELWQIDKNFHLIN